MNPLFGTAGNPEEFYDKGYKSTLEMPSFLKDYGLTAYEYQCGKGLNISAKTAAAFGEKAKEYGIVLSLHSPYYISLSGCDAEVRERSVKYIYDSAVIASAMGARRVVVHSGSCSKLSRSDALEYAKDTIKKALKRLDDEGIDDIILCPETMGKINMLGTPEEIAEICKTDDRLVPALDFGHLNARTLGGLKTTKDFEKIFDTFEDILGYDRVKNFHSHFSKIEYSEGGEKRHLTFEDKLYGPEFEPCADVITKRGYTPVFICESAGTQAKDAFTMKKIYEKYKKLNKHHGDNI